jgi:hypothetical protein
MKPSGRNRALDLRFVTPELGGASPLPPRIPLPSVFCCSVMLLSRTSDALRARAKPLKEADSGPVQESVGRFSPYSLDGVLGGDKDERQRKEARELTRGLSSR